MSFAFILCVSLAPGHHLGLDEPRREISLPKPIGTVVLKGLDGETIRDSGLLTFLGAGYDTEDFARDAGEALRNTLRLVAVATRLPVDVGDDSFRSGAGPSVKAMAAEDGTQLLDHVHGLQVYEEVGTPRIVTVSAQGIVISSRETRFADVLADFVPLSEALGPEEQLACDLLALSAFETSERAKHLTAAIAGEVLSVRRPRSGVAAGLVEDMISQVDCALAEARSQGGQQVEISGLRSLKGQLEMARWESISSAFRGLAAEVGVETQADARDVLKRSYSARSNLVHTGKTNEVLPHLTHELVQVLLDVIVSRAEGKTEEQHAGRQPEGP